jgi:disulfide bond formation protein DsbB
MTLPGPRILSALMAAACAALLAWAYYLQLVVGLEPCPLCIFQRIALIALTLVFIGATLHGARGRAALAWAGLIALAAGAGAAIAARHVWLQNLPPDLVPACGPGLDYLLEVMPAFDVLQEVFTGSGECAKVDWTLLGLSMPVWTLAAFTGFGVVGVWNALRARAAAA